MELIHSKKIKTEQSKSNYNHNLTTSFVFSDFSIFFNSKSFFFKI
jgi:hypothetical protein